MVAPSANTQKIINRFLSRLQKHIVIKEVYLYGSHAKENSGKYSDIDIAVVSPDFKNSTPFDRLVFLGKIAWEAQTPIIEAVGYTPNEFSTKSPLEFPSEIKSHGIPIRINKAA